MVSQVNVKCDFGKGVSEDIYARYGESGRVVSFKFVNSNMEGEVVEVSNARFCLVKSDGNFVIQDFDNSVGLDLTSNMCASSGVGSYEVQVNIDGVVVSGRGSFIVSDRVWNDEVVESVSEGNGLVFPDDFQEKLIAGEGIKIEGNVISWNGTVDWTRWYKDMKEWRESSLIFGEAKFETVEEGLLKELVVGIEPEQDLHGYDKPWIGGDGKNKLPLTLANLKTINTSGTWVDNVYTYLSVNVTVLVDGGDNVTCIKVNGTPSVNFNFILAGKAQLDTFPSGNYPLNGCPVGGTTDGSTYYIGFYAPGKSTYDFGSGTNISLSGNEDSSANVYIRIASGYVAENKEFYPMIRLATETDASFEPYTNICPISWWNNVNITLKDGDGVNQREYSIALGQTVYGGVLDVTNGVLRVTHGEVDLGDLTWFYVRREIRFYTQVSGIKNFGYGEKANILCSIYPVFPWSNSPNYSIFSASGYVSVKDSRYTLTADFKTAVTGQTLVYELAEPYTIQLTPQEILALEGVNNISANSGGLVSCVYSKIARMISARNVYMDNGETVQKAVTDLQ